MPKNNLSRLSLIRCLVTSSISLLLFCSGFLVPFLGMPASVISSAPLAILGVRDGKAWMTLGLLGATLTLWLVLGPGLALAFLFAYGLLSFGITLPLGKLEKGSECFLFCAAISITSKVLFVAASVALLGINPFEWDLSAFRETLHNMYGGMLSGGGQEAERLKETLNRMVDFIPYMLPFFIIVYSMFDSFLNYKLCEFLQRKREGEVKFPPLPSFGEWRFPSSLLYVLVFAFVLPFLTKGNGQLWVMLEYNLKFIANVFFFLQGLALIWWWFSKYAASHSFPLPLRIVLIGVLLMPVFNTWTTAIGVGDICFDFRTKKIKRA